MAHAAEHHFIATDNRSLLLSAMLHLGLLLIAAFGLPALLPDRADPMPLVMTVEILPIGEMTNIRPSQKPITQEKKAPTPVIKKPVPPTAKETPKPVEKVEEKPFDPMEEAEEVPSEKKKVEPKKEEKKTEKQKADEFAALLNQLKQEAKTDKDGKEDTNTEENKTKSDAPFDESMPLSISETDMIRSQFIPCWRMPAGAKDPASLIAKVKVQLQQDGTVLSAAIAPDQQSRYNSDPFFRAAADSAVRAVHKCSPLKNLPQDKYGSWREMELTFDPQDVM